MVWDLHQQRPGPGELRRRLGVRSGAQPNVRLLRMRPSLKWSDILFLLHPPQLCRRLQSAADSDVVAISVWHPNG